MLNFNSTLSFAILFNPLMVITNVHINESKNFNTEKMQIYFKIPSRILYNEYIHNILHETNLRICY